MTHNYKARNYAAQIGNTTVIIRAYLKENAVKFIRSKKGGEDITEKDVYVYDGITGATPVDEVFCEPTREWNEKNELAWKDVYKVRMCEEYAHLV